ncbi:MAG TPA: PASTA domain-containing protein [Gaiellaceae bacterium]|nr:PASTA domain-containing protein [Gaiellaceae bacterium]
MSRSGNTSQIRRAGHRLLLAACLLAVLLIPAAQAAPGALDPSFGTGGKVTTALGPTDAEAYGLALQPDGKLVAAGYASNGSNNDFALARYSPNGSLDTSFGSGGKVTTSFGPSSHDGANALVRQPDGKLVAAGYTSDGSGYDFALARYNADGSLDTSFGSGGKVTTPIGSGHDLAFALVLQPDGKLVAAGDSSNGSDRDFALARYSPNGSLDTSFGSGGKVTTWIGSGNDSAYALAVQPDGKLVAGGSNLQGSQSVVALARFNTNGSLDSGFGTGGKVATAFGGYAWATALALQPDGKLVVGGAGSTGSQQGFALARYNQNGSLDTTFGSAGKVTTAIGSNDGAKAVALQPDGKLVAAGYARAGSADVFALARYGANGSLDTTFGSAGKATAAIGSDDDASALALQPDGKLVVAGGTWNGSKEQFALVRYLGNTLTVTKTGSGSGTVTSNASGINCGSTCSAPFPAAPVQLTATATPGSSFTGWSGDCSGTGPCTVTVSADRAVTATFESDKTLTLEKAGSGTGTVTSSPAGLSCGSTCVQAFKHDTAVTLTAVAAPRSRFTGWSGACSGTTTCTVSMTDARSITATFKALCVVPKVKGKTLRAAKRALKKAHCSVGKVTRVFSTRVPKGRVISPKPRPGKKLAPGARIKLEVSKGKRT